MVAGLAAAVADQPVPVDYARRPDVKPWIDAMSQRLAPRLANTAERTDFLATVYYEATRAGLDPELSSQYSTPLERTFIGGIDVHF